MPTFLKTLIAFIAFMACGKAQCQDSTHWSDYFSVSISHGLNYHLDGNKTIYWDESTSKYRFNNATSFEVSNRFGEKFSLHFFSEHFSGIYQDSVSQLREDLLFSREGYNIGLQLAYLIPLSKRFYILPRIGALRRKGVEIYAPPYHRSFGGIVTRVELSDLGLSSGLSLHYSIGKITRLFALVDYTRFFHLKSSETGNKDFYDGPTLSYVRTRIGLQCYVWPKHSVTY